MSISSALDYQFFLYSEHHFHEKKDSYKLCLKTRLTVSSVGFILGIPLLMAISFWLEQSHKAVAAYHHPNAPSIDHILLGILFYLVLLYHTILMLEYFCLHVVVLMFAASKISIFIDENRAIPLVFMCIL